MKQKIASTASPTKERTSRPLLKQNAPRSNTDVVSKRGAPMSISAEDRRRMISEAAYFLAEKRAWCGECQLDDWLVAEAEINKLFPVRSTVPTRETSR